MLRGHKMMQGEVEDINKLKKADIGVCMPMRVCDIEGEYLWQVKRGDFKRACKILGC